MFCNLAHRRPAGKKSPIQGARDKLQSENATAPRGRKGDVAKIPTVFGKSNFRFGATVQGNRKRTWEDGAVPCAEGLLTIPDKFIDLFAISS